MDVLARWIEAWEAAAPWLEKPELTAPEVSAWPVGRHLKHMALVNRLCAGAIRKTADGAGAGEPAARIWTVIRRSGEIPRGVGEAPEKARPPEAVDTAALRADWERSRDLLARLLAQREELATWTGRVPHPYFGPLGSVDWLHFGAIHTRHHLAIIEDIARPVT